MTDKQNPADQREVMQMALSALDAAVHGYMLVCQRSHALYIDMPESYESLGDAAEALRQALAAPPESVAAVPVAKLRVYMTTHDMGQSLAPNPPFKMTRVDAFKVADDLPLGDYNLYLTAPAREPLDGWISVDDRLPEDGTCVLGAVLTRYSNAPNEYSVCMMVHEYGDWGGYRAPTHWQPLPPAPKAAE